MKSVSLGFRIILVIGIVSGIFLSTYTGFSFSSEMNNVQTTSSLDQDILFSFDEIYQEKIVQLTSNLDLGAFNQLTLFFSVNGSSTKEGLNVCFIINAFSVEFTIDKIFQDGLIHNLTKTFIFSSEYTGYLDITILCSGQSKPDSTVVLTIFDTSIIEKVEVLSLLDTTESLPVFPNWLFFQGNLISWTEGSISSAFYCSKEAAELNLTLSFFVSDIQAFLKTVKLSVNGDWITERNFQENSNNEMSFILQPDVGFNLLHINFSVLVCSDIVEISNISLSGHLVYFEIGSDTFDSIRWEGSSFDHSFDISSLKPLKSQSEQVLHVYVDYQCHGVRLLDGIQYFLKSGSTILKEGRITSFEQMYETNKLEIHIYTTNYPDDIFFTIKGSTSGAGGFLILSTSKIETAPLPKLTEDPLVRIITTEQTVSSLVSIQTVRFYDVFYSPGSLTVNFLFSFRIDSSHRNPFNSTLVKVNTKETMIITYTIHSDGSFYISVIIPLELGYHELQISFLITGLNTPIQIQDLRYQMEILPELPTPALPFDSSVAYWLLGLYAVLLFLFTDKNVFRKRIRREASSQYSTDSLIVENQPKNELKSFLLEILYAVVSFCLLHFVSFAFNIYHWGLTILYSICSAYIGKWLSILKFSWKPFRKTWKNMQEFFSEIDSFTDFFNKIIDFLTNQTKKQIMRFLILISIIFTAAVNIGILVFFDQRPNLMNLQQVSRNYYLLFASFIVTSLFLFYALHLTKKFSFLEDNIRRTRLFGRLSLILVTGSLLVLNVLALSKTFDFSTLWTFLSPLMIVGLTKISNSLGKTIAEEENLTYSKFLKNGKVLTKKKEVRQATEQGIILRKEWKKEKEQLDKNRLRGIIIWEIKPEIPVSLTRLAELMKLSTKKTEQLLDDIMNETPNLGEYHRKEQVFIRNKLDTNNGTETMDEDNASELKLDRVAIERDCDANWVGIVRNRQEASEGWITLPAEMRDKAELGSDYDVFLFTKEGVEVAFTTNLRKSSKSSWYFYISTEICSKNNIYGKEVSAFIRKHKKGKGFPWKRGIDLEDMEILEWKRTKEVLEWEGRIAKGSGRGAGYLTLPIDLRDSVEPGCFYDLSLIDSNLETHVLTVKLSATKKGWGFYIPQALCIEHSLVGEIVTCYIYQMDHFPVKLSADKIIRLPNSIVEEYEIKEHDLFEVEVITDKAIFGEVVLITRVDRSNRPDADEYRFTLRLSDAPRSTEARIKLVKRVEKLLSNLKEENYKNFYLPKLFPDGIMGKVHENEMIIFLGNHVPIFTPIRINLLEFIHYFGCYYADGTKKGWAWRISASTPEQAVYYVEKYNQIVYGNQLVFRLTYSKKPSDKRKKEKVKEDLIKYWKEQADVEIEKKNITLRETKHDNVRKWNKCGSLEIKDNRNLIMEMHLRLLEETERIVVHNVNNEHSWNFLFGILEGDGFVSGGKGRFGVGFSTHSSDKIIEKALIKLGINYRSDRSRVKNGVPAGITFQFGLFEVLQNLEILSKNIFKYYPKRRQTFVSRLLNQASVQNLLGNDKAVYIGTTASAISYSLDAGKLRGLLDKFILEMEQN